MNKVTGLSIQLILLCILANTQVHQATEDEPPPNNTKLTLEERLAIQHATWHWHPYQGIRYHIDHGKLVEDECKTSHAIDDFPHNLFTHEQRLNGAIILHFVVALYFFIVLATICSRYFLPSVKAICKALSIPTDVAAATFMALATTIPEFFTNTISTFITVSDMGFGTIIGSMLFNTLGVAACAAFAAPGIVQLAWWPISRDSVLFIINLIMLTSITWDGQVNWYESFIQVGMLILYFTVMFNNGRLQTIFTKLCSNWICCRNVAFDGEANLSDARSTVSGTNKTTEGVANPAFVKSLDDKKSDAAVGPAIASIPPVDDDDDDGDDGLTLWAKPDGSKFEVAWWILTWPIRLILTVTIPNVKTYPRLFFLTFFMCMIMLAICSYIIFWMVVIIGFTFGIPESIMGMTLLAAGGCLPEATSAVLMIRTGSGALGVSNSLGANSLAIMFSLGLPWLLRNMVDGAWTTGANHNIGSSGLEWIVLSLILAVAAMYTVVMLCKYVLRTRIGFILAGIYLIFVTFAILVEMDILIPNEIC